MGIMPTAHALSSDAEDACGAVLCLSSSTRPGGCAGYLDRYFDIKDKNPAKMVRKRLNFLNLCPTSHETPEMQALVSAISQGAGRCDAQFLNTSNKKTITYREYERQYEDGNYKYYWVTKKKEVIDSKAPNYCSIYQNHEFTDLATAKYVGDEFNGGRWVAPADYDRALQEYQDKLPPRNQNQIRW